MMLPAMRAVEAIQVGKDAVKALVNGVEVWVASFHCCGVKPLPRTIISLVVNCSIQGLVLTLPEKPPAEAPPPTGEAPPPPPEPPRPPAVPSSIGMMSAG